MLGKQTSRVEPSKVFASARARSRVAKEILEALGLDDVPGKKATGTTRNVVRAFDDAVAIPMLDADGNISNVLRLDASGAVTGMDGVLLAGTLIGSPSEITNRRDAVLVIGAVEALTAALKFPTSVILGALHARHFADLAPSITRRVKLAGGSLYLVVADTDDGENVAIDAARAAMSLDLPLHRRVFVVDTGTASTLNESWRRDRKASR